MAYHTNDKITDGLSRLDNFLPKRKIFQKHRRQNLSRVKAWRKQLDDLHGKTSIATAKKFLNQRSAYSIRKTSIFSDAFRLTVVNFFMELYKLTRNAARRKKYLKPRFRFSFFVTHVTQQVTKRKYNSSWCLSGCHRCLYRCLDCLLQQ